MFQSENFFSFLGNSNYLPSPWWEGIKGRGDKTLFVHPHLLPPPSKGEEILYGKFQICLAIFGFKARDKMI
jgi:hypothetical protein